MWISNLTTRGFSATPTDVWGPELGRVERGAPAVALDGLALLSGALAPARRPWVSAWLGWGASWEDGELTLGRPIQEAEPSAHPALVVEVVIEPDPPMFGRIREGVMRDPERAAGLAVGTLAVRVGWQLTRDRRIVRPDLIGVRLGDVPLPLGELPAWVRPLLEAIGGRVGVVGRDEPLEQVAARVGQALLGDDPEARVAARRALEVAGVELVRTGVDWRFASVGALLPVRWGAPGLEDRIRLTEAGLLGRPDVLVVPWAVDDATHAWLASLCEGDDAVLEQVVTR